MPRVLGVIPARYGSTRFPGKPLAPLADRPMLEQVWRRVRAAARLDRVLIATEDRRIVEAAERFGAEVLLTSAAHESGTDRVAETVERLTERYDVVLNVQGDEPLVTPSCLDRLAAAFDGAGAPSIATLAEPISSSEELFDPNVVKVVVAHDGRALYFSRAPIPFYRGAEGLEGPDFRGALVQRRDGLAGYRKHQGIYAYTRESLLALARLPVSPLERSEGLEQLRALEAGHRILVLDSDFRSMAVDTPGDLERVERLLMEEAQ